MKSSPRERIVLFLLNVLALLLCTITGCKLIEKKLDRVYWNGQWYSREDYEKARR